MRASSVTPPLPIGGAAQKMAAIAPGKITSDRNPADKIVFIDSNVPSLSTLTGGVKPGELVFVLDSDQDGLQQIANILAANNLQNLQAIHVVSHGGPGRIQLGSTTIEDRDLFKRATTLARIGATLAPDGEIELYGCEVARGLVGPGSLPICRSSRTPMLRRQRIRSAAPPPMEAGNSTQRLGQSI